MINVMEFFIWCIFSSRDFRRHFSYFLFNVGCDMIVSDNVLRLRLEPFRYRARTENVIDCFSNLILFQSCISGWNVFLENLELRTLGRGALLFCEMCAREPGWRFTSRCNDYAKVIAAVCCLGFFLNFLDEIMTGHGQWSFNSSCS